MAEICGKKSHFLWQFKFPSWKVVLTNLYYKVIFGKRVHVFSSLSLTHYSKSLMFCFQDIRVHILVQCYTFVTTSLHFKDNRNFLPVHIAICVGRPNKYCGSEASFSWLSKWCCKRFVRWPAGPQNSLSCDFQLRHSRVEKSETTSRNSDNYFKHKE